MSGAYRRAIVVRSGQGEADCELEDDFHHFHVRLRHDGHAVLSAVGEAIRHPWNTCPLAGGALDALKGALITTDPSLTYGYTDTRSQCTHMLEMSVLAVTQAARGIGSRRYDAEVTDALDGLQEASLRCDGAVILRWLLQDGQIADPPKLAGRKPSSFRSRDMSAFPPQEAEAILILKAAVAASIGRLLDLESFQAATQMQQGFACFVFRPGMVERSTRVRGSIRDFSSSCPLPPKLDSN